MKIVVLRRFTWIREPVFDPTQSSAASIIDAIDRLPLTNAAVVVGLHSNADACLNVQTIKDIWLYLIELKPHPGQYCVCACLRGRERERE